MGQDGRWASLYERLQTSLWVTPVVYTGLCGMLAVGLLYVDRSLQLPQDAWFSYPGQADGARELLSTIASSMLSIAGVAFSITILVLQLASSQFSPRVLRTFLQDGVTQRALAMFLGTFVYAMVLLPRIHSGDGQLSAFVPGTAITVAFVLALLSIGFFVRYIHHMAHSIRAVNIMMRVAQETHGAIQKLYPNAFTGTDDDAAAGPSTSPDLVIEHEGIGQVVISVDEDSLMEVALKHDLTIAVVRRVGDFVPRGAPLLHVWGASAAERLHGRDWVALATERTPHQDAAFGFRQLVDIAERALSPGVNDPSTAAQALDRLHDLLRTLCQRGIPSARRLDEGGRVRLVLPRPGWADYVRLSFEELRTYGTGSLQVVRKARDVLEDLVAVAPPGRVGALQEQLRLLDIAARGRSPDAAS